VHDLAMPELSVSTIKNRLRHEIWKHLEEHNLARFPRPVYNRIPNFVGAEKAAIRIRELNEFIMADVLKVNPDAPQAYVRQIVVEEGKTLLMPTPRISAGFLRLDSKCIDKQMIRKAVSISGAFKIGQRIPVSKLPTVDLVVAGSVAVSLEGLGRAKGTVRLNMESSAKAVSLMIMSKSQPPFTIANLLVHFQLRDTICRLIMF
jgi:5-formyltetrahydrofolate cyclo-ligase